MAKFKLGDKVIMYSDLADTNSIQVGTIIELPITANNHEPVSAKVRLIDGFESWYYTAFLWPTSVDQELYNIVKQREELKKTFDDSMKLIYALRNKLATSN